ncbi:unnamed protein product [Owenia fusiformis]|uniref:Uncharacterized protein n=1 Tax=Owenia fusiformis TaxID=6347 RepID=A0A8J1XGD1_OWEFU|nr:unnamed protein product [Owenia fusiformis]
MPDIVQSILCSKQFHPSVHTLGLICENLMAKLLKYRMFQKMLPIGGFAIIFTLINASLMLGFAAKPYGTIQDKMREFDMRNMKEAEVFEQNNEDMCISKAIYSKKTQAKRKFLTLFTTFADAEPIRYTVQNNTICNYLNFPEDLVHLVAFVDKAVYQYQFNEHINICGGHSNFDIKRWHLVVLPKSSTYLDRPFLKDMFIYAMREFDSELYMYTNGDILYPWGHLQRSFQAVTTFVERHELHEYIISGLRREVTFYSGSGLDVEKLNTGDDEEILNIGNSFEPTRPYALDYFITNKTSFPWHTIPAFVIGSVRFDNWLVMYANKLKIPVFDITQSTPVVHQAGIPKIGDKRARDTNNYNLQLFQESIINNKNYGRIKQCAHFRTIFFKHRVKVIKNNYYLRECMHKDMFYIPIL